MSQLDSLLTLRQLRYFLSVFEHRSFSAAARALLVAQPSLSRQIGQIEAALDERLLVRHADGVVPTEAGERLYHLARTILDQVNGARAEVRGEQRTPQGKVAMALPAMAGYNLMAQVVQVCKAELPQVELQVIDGFSTLNSQLLEAGLVDFGVMPDAEEIPGLHFEPLFTEHLYLVSSAGTDHHPVRAEVGLAEAFATPLVLGPRATHLRRYLEHTASTHGLALNVVREQQSMGVIAAFVRAGLGATVANWPSIAENVVLPAAHIQRIVDPPLGRLVAIGHPSARPLNHAAAAVYAIVKRLLLAARAGGQWRGEPI